MIEAGKITEFSQIFQYAPKSVMAADLNSSTRRLTRLSSHLSTLEIGEISAISELIGVKMDVIYGIVERQFLSQRTDTSKKEKNNSY